MTIRLIAVGDISFGRHVDRVLHEYGPRHFFAFTNPLLQRANILFGNLEAPLSTRGQYKTRESINLPDGRIHQFVPLRGTPEAVVALGDAGFHVVSLANNHMMDYGPDALIDTLDLLEANDIQHIGAGRTRYEAEQPAILVRDGVAIAFLGFTVSGQPATKSEPGIALAREDRIIAAVKAAQRNADLVVLSLHWGAEGQRYPFPWQREWAMKALEAGASIILGHHPHVIQGYETLGSKLVAYSLGNFIFDIIENGWGDGLVMECDLVDQSQFYFHPIRINEHFQPRPLDGVEKEIVLQHLEQCSLPFSDPDHPIWQELKRHQEITDALNLYVGLRVNPFLLVARLHRLRCRHVVSAGRMLKVLICKLIEGNQGASNKSKNTL